MSLYRILFVSQQVLSCLSVCIPLLLHSKDNSSFALKCLLRSFRLPLSQFHSQWYKQWEDKVRAPHPSLRGIHISRPSHQKGTQTDHETCRSTTQRPSEWSEGNSTSQSAVFGLDQTAKLFGRGTREEQPHWEFCWSRWTCWCRNILTKKNAGRTEHNQWRKVPWERKLFASPLSSLV